MFVRSLEVLGAATALLLSDPTLFVDRILLLSLRSGVRGAYSGSDIAEETSVMALAIVLVAVVAPLEMAVGEP